MVWTRSGNCRSNFSPSTMGSMRKSSLAAVGYAQRGSSSSSADLAPFTPLFSALIILSRLIARFAYSIFRFADLGNSFQSSSNDLIKSALRSPCTNRVPSTISIPPASHFPPIRATDRSDRLEESRRIFRSWNSPVVHVTTNNRIRG